VSQTLLQQSELRLHESPMFGWHAPPELLPPPLLLRPPLLLLLRPPLELPPLLAEGGVEQVLSVDA
jgi:hypothetical protein